MTTTPPYIAAVSVEDLFVDPTYQRDCDVRRARSMAEQWEPQLVGVLEVSDRGEHTTPRYAIINGQHRWAAAGFRDPNAHMVVNVHTGLSVSDEAKLFDDIDRKTRNLTTWDRWKARSAACDPIVKAIESAVQQCGYVVSDRPSSTPTLRCPSALEKIFDTGGEKLIADTLLLLVDVWPGNPDALEASIVQGVANVLDTFEVEGSTFSTGRLADAMSDVTPRSVKAQAQSLREFQSGTVSKLVGVVLVRLYNKTRGTKIDEAAL